MFEQVGRAFLAYGRAMAKAIGIEQVLRLALMEHEVRKAVEAGAPVDGEKFSQKLLRMDFGQLLQQVYQKYGLESEFLAVVRTAKDARDYMAHNFWVGHLGNLRSERGLDIILRHCGVIEKQIDRVSDYIVERTGVDAWRFIGFIDERADNKAAHEGWEAFLAVSEASFERP